MIRIPGYNITERLDDTRRSTTLRGRREGDGTPVLLWALHTDASRAADLARLKHEYEAIQRIEADSVVRVLAIEDTGEHLVLVMEDFPGAPLAEVLAARPRLSLSEALDLAARLARAIADVHGAGVVHRDLRPRNILIGEGEQLKLTRFGAAHAVTREDEHIYDRSVIDELLPYVSPEHTGRMNRQVDHRTDLYSLGAVLYEVLTGRRPFAGDDPMAIIHAHLALLPEPPSAIEPAVPQVVSDIVMRLLAKNAEDRYSAAEGVLHDLERCRAQWATEGRVDLFPIGERDRGDLFQIHQTLYGRERDIEALTRSFDDVLAGARRIVLVSGYSGIGKSSLVQEILKPLARERGYYTSGKYDQYNRDTPYSALIQAFDTLVRQLLSESEERIGRWREALLGALGSNGQVLCDVVPSLRHLIGEQPPVPALGPMESQNRLNLVFTRFVSVFARPAHPLALFIDDLQWADPASLGLLQTILSGEMESLFFCGAYRDNEVDPAHPFIMAVEELKKSGLEVADIVLGPLELQHLVELIEDSLRTRGGAALASVVLEKTGGNPFFVKQFIRHLHEIQALDFDPAVGWRWDLDDIAALEHTDNVVDLMVQAIRRLPAATQRTLELAAAIGSRFDLRVLSTVSACSHEEAYARLAGALREGLVLGAGEEYRFAHDKIQEAAYSMIPEAQRPAFHHRIGKLLLEGMAPAGGRELFDVVKHLNSAGDLVADPSEREALARLNLQAAARAEESAAFGAALHYVDQGMARLPADPWRDAYALTLDYHSTKGFMESLCGRHEDALRTLSIAFEHAKGRLDQTRVRRLRINVHVLKNDLSAALDEGLAVMRAFGIDLPPFPDDEALSAELSATLALIGDRTDDDLLALPELEDPEIAVLMDVLRDLFAPCYFLASNNYGITVMKILQSTIRHGISPSSIYAFVNFGMFLCVRMEIDQGYRFGRLAVRLNERCADKKQESMLRNMWGAFIQHWKETYGPYKATLVQGMHAGLETGEYIWAFYNMVNCSTNSLLRGLPLAEVVAEARAYLAVCKLDRFNAITWMNGAVGQICHNLMEPTERPAELVGEWIDIGAVIEEARRIVSRAAMFFANLYRVILGVFQGAYEETATIADDSDPSIVGVAGWHGTPAYHFYAAVAYTRAAAAAAPERRAACLAKARAYAARLEGWARHCPESMLHRSMLLAAELRRADGDAEGASAAYDEAIAAAREGRYLQDEALGNELCARHYLALGRTTLARAYLAEAQELYARWGAVEAAERLARELPALVARLERRRPTPEDPSAAPSEAGAATWTGPLDALSVLKASQAISEELLLPRLLQRLMRVILENAGARKGFLVLADGARLVVEAEGHVGRAEVDVLRAIPVDTHPGLSAHVVHYVARTGESVVAADAAGEGRFANDPYLAGSKARSVLATPILRQGRLAGVIYLENELVTGAFTPERIEVLRTLAAQAAISIENAALYARLEEKVNARTAELREAHEHIVALSLAEQERKEQDLREKAQLILRQEELIRALSAPIIQVWDDVLTIPLVAGLDDQRAAEMTQRLLERIVGTRSRYAILDLTGVAEIDAATAERIARVISAARLLGARGVITGVQPEVARVMTSLGVDLREVATFANVREALRACMAGAPRAASPRLG